MATLQEMQKLVSEAITDWQFHQRIAMVWRDNEIGGIDRWIRGHFRYRGEREEVLRTPRFMFDQIQETGYFEGDCDDCAIMTAAVLRILGYRVRFVAIRYDSTEFQHVFVEAYSPDQGRWVVLDATVNPGTQYRELERMVVSV